MRQFRQWVQRLTAFAVLRPHLVFASIRDALSKGGCSMSNRSGWMLCLLAATLFAAHVPARAGPLAPGERRGDESMRLDLNDPSFAGDTLLSETTPFDIIFEQPEGSPPNSVNGTLTHLVVRESATGNLAFHYRLQGDVVGGVIDFEDLIVNGFAGFTTDVFSDQDSFGIGTASRSANGDTVTFQGDEEPFSGNFVIRTNATEFEAGAGSTAVLVRAQTGEPIGGPDRTVTLAATAAPLADDGGPGPNPIPLPPAVWAGLATMGGFGAMKRLRQRRAS
jgi:hypothetical protein